MRGWILAVALLAGPVWAADARQDGAAIAAALTGRTVDHDDGTSQVFKADGQTIFDNGRQSMGQWAANVIARSGRRVTPGPVMM